MPTWRCAPVRKLSAHQTSVYRFKLHARSTMFGAWILSLTVCLTAEESNASLWPMTSATSELTLQWTLESPANMPQDLLDQATIFRGYPVAVRTDNEPEFTSRAFLAWTTLHGIRHILIQPGRPMQNSYIASFNGKFRDECLNE